MQTHRISGLALGALLVIGSFTLGRASTGTTFDASFWNSLSDDQRLHFVQGVTDGASLGFVQGYIDGATAAFKKADEDLTLMEQTKDVVPIDGLLDAMHKRLVAQKPQLMEEMLKLKTTPPVFSETYATYIDRVTSYYAKNPSKSDASPAAIVMRWNQK
jgi:hypothetical protein